MRRAFLPLIAILILVAVAIALLRAPPPPVIGPSANASQSAASSSTAPVFAPTSTSAAPVAASGSAAPAKTQTLFTATWGTKLGQLGRSDPKEANPEAPMSFVVDKNGVTWVLDQVNGRIMRFGKDGKPLDEIRINLRGAQDLALTKDGNVVVLDRLADKQIQIYSPDGKVVGALPVETNGVKEGGAVTGVFVDGKDVYLENEHENLVKVGDTDGKKSDDKKEIPGRPSRDGQSYLKAYLTSIPGHDAIVTSTVRETEAMRFTRKLTDPMLLTGIVLLDSDAAGIIYLGVLATKTTESGESAGAPLVEIYCLEPEHGAPIGTVTVPANDSPHETFRELTVLDSGGVLYLSRNDSGATATKLDCRPGS